MKIDLKNIRYSASLSEETNAFTADVYIDGAKAAIAANRGHGASTDIAPLSEESRDLIARAEQWCKTLPPDKLELNGEEVSFPVNLESYIDALIDDYVNDKNLKSFRRKMAKAAETGIIFGIADKSYRACQFSKPIALLIQSESGRIALKNTLVNTILPKMEAGEQILNTNIPLAILKAAGLKEDQYPQPLPDEKSLKTAGKRQRKGL